MRRCEPINIGRLWAEFKRRNPQVERKLAAGRIPEAWGKVTGRGVAALTSRLELKGGVLNVSVTSSVVRHELFLRRQALVQAINKEIEADIVRDIYIH